MSVNCAYCKLRFIASPGMSCGPEGLCEKCTSQAEIDLRKRLNAPQEELRKDDEE